MLCHNLCQLLIAGLTGIPTQHRAGLCRVTPQVVYIGRAKPLRIYANQHLSGFCIVAFFLQTSAFPADVDTVCGKCLFSEVTDSVLTELLG